MLMCLAVCWGQQLLQAAVVTLGTRRLNRKLARPVFSVRIRVANALSAFARLSCILILPLVKEARCASVGKGTRS